MEAFEDLHLSKFEPLASIVVAQQPPNQSVTRGNIADEQDLQLVLPVAALQVSTNNSLAASACNEYSPPPGASTNGIQCSASFQDSCSNYASSSITTGVVRESSNTNACGTSGGS